MKPWFDQERFGALRVQRGATWGRPVRTLDEVSSTNDCALKAIAGSDRTGIVWLARRQLQGRGRRGRRWESEEDRSLMMSVLLRVPKAQERLGGVPLAVGLAVRAAIAPRLAAFHAVQVKWPNDVLVGSKKLAGVLVESRPDPSGAIGLVVGIGVNVQRGSWPEEIASSACSLAELGATDLDFESLLVDLILEMERRIPVVFTRGFSALHAEFAGSDALFQRAVEVEQSNHGATLHGVARGVDGDGRLLVGLANSEKDAGERIVAIGAGTVRISTGGV